jgi:hypothetical protein
MVTGVSNRSLTRALNGGLSRYTPEPRSSLPPAQNRTMQQRIDISDAGNSAQAVKAASRAFEAFYGCPWKLHADSIKVIAADPQ